MPEQIIGLRIKLRGTEEQINTLDDLKKKLVEVKTAIGGTEIGSELYKELAKDQAAVGKELDILTAQQKALNKEFAKVSYAVGSYDELNDTLGKLRKEFKGLSEAERESARGNDLLNKIGKLDSKLKDLDKSIGQSFRNVGNYDQAVQGGVAKLTAHLNGMKGEISAVSSELGGIASQIGGIGGQIGQGLSGLGSIVGAGGGLAGGMAIAAGMGEALKYTIETTREVSKLRTEINQLTGAQGEQLAAYAAHVAAIEKVSGKQSEDIEIAAMNFSRLTGSYEESLKLIEKSYLDGSASSEDFLKQLKEYPSQFEKAGLSATDFLNTIKAQKDLGVYDDKLVDAVKEGGIQISTMSKAATDAMNSLGIDANKAYADINSGARTTGDVIREISRKLNELPKGSTVASKAISDIFRAMGEDVPEEAILSLDKILGQMEKEVDLSDPVVAARKKQMDATLDLTKAQGELADKSGIVGANMDTLGIQAQTVLTKFISLYLDGIKPITDGLYDIYMLFSDIIKLFTGKGVEDTINFFDVLTATVTVLTTPVRVFWGYLSAITSGFRELIATGDPLKAFFATQESAWKSAKGWLQGVGLMAKDVKQVEVKKTVEPATGGDKPTAEELKKQKELEQANEVETPEQKAARKARERELAAAKKKKELDEAIYLQLLEAAQFETKWREMNRAANAEFEKLHPISRIDNGVTISITDVVNEKNLQDAATEAMAAGAEARKKLAEQDKADAAQRHNDKMNQYATELQFLSEFVKASAALTNSARDKALAKDKKYTDEQLAMLKQRKDQGLITEIEYQKQVAQIQKDGEEKQIQHRKAYGIAMKALSIAEIIINAAVEISRASLNANAPSVQNVATGGIWGLTQSQVATGLIIARSAAAIAGVAAQKYARGGVVDGPSHDEGGVPIFGGRAEVEGGEGIINRHAMADPNLRAVASWVNTQRGGGVKFAQGGIVPSFPFIGQPIFSPNNAVANLDTTMQAQIRAMNMRLDTLKVINVVAETDAISRQRVRTEQRARL